MTRQIICAECPGVYGPQEIYATFGDEVTTLEALENSGNPTDTTGQTNKRGRWKRSTLPQGPRSLSRDDLASHLVRLRAWTFTCPYEHVVDGNRGATMPIAVIGESGASKSHFLPAIVWELNHERVLAPLGITLREALYSKVGLDTSIDAVYERHEVLPPTPPGTLYGPFGYRLAIREDGFESQYSLLLFDIAGEAFSSIIKIAENAAFILLCRGLVVLLDPVGMLPTSFDTDALSQRTKVLTSNRVRKGIGRIADTLEEVFRTPPQELRIPVCFVVAKADCLQWSFNWHEQTRNVIAGAPGNLHMALKDASSSVEAAYVDYGGALVVQEIQDRFNPEYTRFVAASATCEMPTQRDGRARWVDPNAQGSALALLHLLALNDVVRGGARSSRR